MCDLFLTYNALSFQYTETVTTGLSDFHKLVLAVLKNAISKNKPGEIHCRNYKKFDSLKFNVDLENAFTHEKIESYIKFDKAFMKVLNRHAPFKNKIQRASHYHIFLKRLEKQLSGDLILTKSIFEKKQVSVLEPAKSEKIIAADFIRKKEKSFLMG